MDIRLHNIILSNSVRIIITFHYCLVRYVATPTKFSFTVCLCRMRTICLKSRRRFATLSVDGKRADVLDLLWLVRRWKFDIGCLVDNIRSRLWSIGSLPSFGKGGGKSVLVVRAKFFFFFRSRSSGDCRFGANRTVRVYLREEKKNESQQRYWWV